MSLDIDTANPPFGLLDDAQRNRVASSMDIAYFNPGETLIEPGKRPDSLFVIVKGLVEEHEAAADTVPDSVVAQYRDGDHFGSLAILRGAARHRYVAGEETIVRLLPSEVFTDLAHENAEFGAYFHRDLATRSKLVARSAAHRDFVGFSLARIDDRAVRDALIVATGTSVGAAIRIMRDAGADCLLVDADGRFGMVTRTDLLDAVADGPGGLDRDVAAIATFDLATVKPGAYLFDALIEMTRRHIERVVVMDGGHLSGIVELRDVLGFLSSHSHVVALKVAAAESTESLAHAADGMFELVRSLVAQQVPIRFIMDLLAALNRRIVARLFELTIPRDVADRVCLLVTGSEGRGEQVMRTDQNNALILPDDLAWPDREADLGRFTDRMVTLGYPRSPAGIMVSNPAWTMSAQKWRKRIADWIVTRDAGSVLALSALLDATPVAGDSTLFDALSTELDRSLPRTGSFFDALLRPLRESAPPAVLFDKRTRRTLTIDIKAAGIFPLVHAVRARALACGIASANTFERLEGLKSRDAIATDTATDLGEALSLFMQIRLRRQLERHDAAAGAPVDPGDANRIETGLLTRPETELLREALRLVREFRRETLDRFSVPG